MTVLLFQSDNIVIFGSLKFTRDTVATCSLQVTPRDSILLFSFVMHCQILKITLGLSLQDFLLQVLALDQEQKAKGDALHS